MRALLFWGSALLLSMLLGLGATVAWLWGSGFGGGITVGPWQTSLATGGVDADAWTRALLALNRSETMYYTATHDSEGARLSGDCDYRLEGQDLAARWWSITAYGADSYLIRNRQERYSFSQTSVRREPDGGFVIHLSERETQGNWLPVKAGAPFELTARFYNPAQSVQEQPAAVQLPLIVRGECR
jgi:hypothetical protein